MATIYHINSDSRNTVLRVEIKDLRSEILKELNLYTPETYPDRNKAIPLVDLTEGSSNFNIPASALGEYFFDGMYILEFVFEKQDGSTYTVYGVYATMEKILRCFIQGTLDLNVKDCELLTDSECSCVDDIVYSFINLEALDTLFKTNNLLLASKIYLSLCNKCSLNCIGLEDLENDMILRYATYDDKIILTGEYVMPV